MFIVGGFGWGKPVQYNPYALNASPRTGPMLVALGGPVSNVLLATLFALPARLMPILLHTTAEALFYAPTSPDGLLYNLLYYIVYYNLLLSIFNLLPVFPLDGFSVLQGLLPAELAEQFERTRPYGFLILLLLLFIGGSIIGPILYGPVNTLRDLLLFAGT